MRRNNRANSEKTRKKSKNSKRFITVRESIMRKTTKMSENDEGSLGEFFKKNQENDKFTNLQDF